MPKITKTKIQQTGKSVDRGVLGGGCGGDGKQAGRQVGRVGSQVPRVCTDGSGQQFFPELIMAVSWGVNKRDRDRVRDSRDYIQYILYSTYGR